MIEQNDKIHDIEVRVHHKKIIIKIIIHKTEIVLSQEIVLVMTKALLLLQNTLVHGMTIIKETRDHIVLLIDPPANHLIGVTRVTDIDHAHTLLDHHRDQ